MKQHLIGFIVIIACAVLGWIIGTLSVDKPAPVSKKIEISV